MCNHFCKYLYLKYLLSNVNTDYHYTSVLPLLILNIIIILYSPFIEITSNCKMFTITKKLVIVVKLRHIVCTLAL